MRVMYATLLIPVIRNLEILFKRFIWIHFDKYLLLQATILVRNKAVLGVVFAVHAYWL
jgi:hypothetical protein